MQRITKAETDWAFEASDHAAVKICFLMDEPEKGPGIRKVNTRILDDMNVEKQIGTEMRGMMNQTDYTWNPHMKLEFMKMAIRTIFSSKVAEIRKSENTELKEKEEEMNQNQKFKNQDTHKLKHNKSRKKRQTGYH
jgi:hypothetical protein